MQITSHVTNKPVTTESPFEIKNGEIYSAQVKERLSDKEAVLQIRGREVVAQFESKVPAGDRATIQVTAGQDQKLTVKEITVDATQANKKSPELSQVLQRVGLTGKESPELRDAVKLLFDKGAPLSKEIVSELKTFFEKGSGTPEAKGDTVRALLNKGLEVTQNHLRSIHEALHGKPLNEVLNNIAKELNLDLSIKEKPVAIQPNRPAVTTPVVARTISQSAPTISQAPVQTAAAEAISSIRNILEKEPDLQKAIQAVKEVIANNPKISREVAQQIEKVAGDAEKLQTIGRERVIQALRNAEAQLQSKVQQPIETKQVVHQANQNLETTVKDLKTEVRTNPNLQRSIDRVVAEVLRNEQLPKHSAPKIERAVTEASTLLKQGRMTAGREVLSNALATLENEVAESQRNESVPRQANDSRPVEKSAQQSNDTRVNETTSRPAIDSRPVDGNNRQPIDSRASTETQRQAVEQPRASEVIRQVKESVQQEPRLQKAVEQVRDQIINNPKIDREVVQKVERAVQEATQLQRLGQEGSGRERLVQALASAEVEMKQVEGSRSETVQRQPVETKPSTETRQPVDSRQPTETRIPAETRPTDTRLPATSTQQPTESRQQPAQDAALKDSIKQVREQLQTEPDIKKVLPKLQNEVINHKNMDPEVARTIEKAANQANQLHEAGRERLVKLLQQIETNLKAEQPNNNQNQLAEQANQTGKQAAQNLTQQATQDNDTIQPTQAQKLPSETVMQALKQFQSESDVDKAIDLVRKEVSANPNIDMANISKIEKTLENAQQLTDRGREIAARQQVANELNEIQQSLAKSEPKLDSTQSASNQYDVNELLQSMQVKSKDILVTRVTQQLAEVTQQFRELKREITRTLDSVQRTIDMFKNSAQPQATKMLETAISKLDNAILKSDMMLFTDMKQEKQLLQASSQLAEAKKLLAKGQFSEASKIVEQVKNLIDKINFKPTDQKVMHFVGKESLAMENRNHVLETAARGFTLPEPSAKHMYEAVRSLGLNHDSELANSLVFKNGEQAKQEQLQQNMKAVLMKLQQEEAGTRVAQQAEQALNNLTGQQLLSKSDANGTMQSMLFNLPMLLGGDPKNLQVFVNSKNEGQQVDWENCNLYFLIETKKLGDVGIMLTSTERNLTITIKNDKPGFKERMEPLASMAKEKLGEIGYNVNGLHFTRMTPMQANNEVNQTIDQTPKKPIFTEKGLDFKI